MYVPRPPLSPALAHILPATALTGFPDQDNPEVIHVYYEGNRYHSPDLARFADRVHRAATRLRDSAPTAAQAFIPSADLFHVALYDDILGLVTPLGDDQARLLAIWIRSGDPHELQATGAHFEHRRHQLGHPNSQPEP